MLEAWYAEPHRAIHEIPGHTTSVCSPTRARESAMLHEHHCTDGQEQCRGWFGDCRLDGDVVNRDGRGAAEKIPIRPQLQAKDRLWKKQPKKGRQNLREVG